MNKRKKFNYKGMPVDILGLPVSNDNKKLKNISKRKYLKSFGYSVKKDSLLNLIVMYDIPHNLKKERDWFRRHLIKFGYVMIQKSVWVGPSPLPKDFLEYVKEIKIGNNFKTFKLAKSYNSYISAMA